MKSNRLLRLSPLSLPRLPIHIYPRSTQIAPSIRLSAYTTGPKQPVYTYNIPAPKPNSGPILKRSSQRDLPQLNSIENPWRIWRHLPLVLVTIVAGAFGIINYEKINHSVVASCLYALRANPQARELLGDEIYFASSFPFIHGPIDPMHGVIDVKFGVKGSKSSGIMRFRCTRQHRRDFFKMDEWSLSMSNGTILNLLETEADVNPMTRSELPVEEVVQSA